MSFTWILKSSNSQGIKVLAYQRINPILGGKLVLKGHIHLIQSHVLSLSSFTSFSFNGDIIRR